MRVWTTKLPTYLYSVFACYYFIASSFVPPPLRACHDIFNANWVEPKRHFCMQLLHRFCHFWWPAVYFCTWSVIILQCIFASNKQKYCQNPIVLIPLHHRNPLGSNLVKPKLTENPFFFVKKPIVSKPLHHEDPLFESVKLSLLGR